MAGDQMVRNDAMIWAESDDRQMSSDDRFPSHPNSAITYLACPYSDPSPDVRQRRYEQVNKVAALLMRCGIFVFCPISHCHELAKQNGLPTDFAYWRKYNAAFLSMCSDLYVVTMPGWESSVGVTGEIKIAQELGLSVVYLDPEIVDNQETLD
jgi:hypothetical protein